MANTGSLPPLNALRAFEAAGRHLNFRLAAEEIGVTQSAVAQHVRGLEARLGLPLFERRHKALAFSDVGRRYHMQISQAFSILTEATAALAPAPQKVTISVTPSFASRWLIPHLGDFAAHCPEVDLHILATESLSRFHSDGIDLAVRQGQPPFGASLDVAKLFSQDIIAVCDPLLVADHHLPLPAETFLSLALLHDTHDLWPVFIKAAFGPGEAMRVKGVRFTQTAHSIEAALAGQGVALASRFLVARDLEAGRLVQPVSHVLQGGRDFYLLAPRGARRPKAAGAVWRWLLARCQSMSEPGI